MFFTSALSFCPMFVLFFPLNFLFNSSSSYLHSKNQNLWLICLFDRCILYSKLTKAIFLSILKQRLLYMWDTTPNGKIPGILFVIIKKKCKNAAREICWRVRGRFLKIRNFSFFIRKRGKKHFFKYTITLLWL